VLISPGSRHIAYTDMEIVLGEPYPRPNLPGTRDSTLFGLMAEGRSIKDAAFSMAEFSL
jgi:hypothetical protein